MVIAKRRSFSVLSLAQIISTAIDSHWPTQTSTVVTLNLKHGPFINLGHHPRDLNLEKQSLQLAEQISKQKQLTFKAVQKRQQQAKLKAQRKQAIRTRK